MKLLLFKRTNEANAYRFPKIASRSSSSSMRETNAISSKKIQFNANDVDKYCECLMIVFAHKARLKNASLTISFAIVSTFQNKV